MVKARETTVGRRRAQEVPADAAVASPSVGVDSRQLSAELAAMEREVGAAVDKVWNPDVRSVQERRRDVRQLSPPVSDWVHAYAAGGFKPDFLVRSEDVGGIITAASRIQLGNCSVQEGVKPLEGLRVFEPSKDFALDQADMLPYNHLVDVAKQARVEESSLQRALIGALVLQDYNKTKGVSPDVTPDLVRETGFHGGLAITIAGALSEVVLLPLSYLTNPPNLLWAIGLIPTIGGLFVQAGLTVLSSGMEASPRLNEFVSNNPVAKFAVRTYSRIRYALMGEETAKYTTNEGGLARQYWHGQAWKDLEKDSPPTAPTRPTVERW
ncbi:Uncharacterised protein [uncultured archaeon]|nr:Uncharacterised protein [uncultured archaeon]